MRTIARFTKAEDAHNFRAFLEGSGLPAFVRDENTVGADPLYANAIGGLRVEVEDENFQQARELYSAVHTPAAPVAVPRHPATRYLKFFAGSLPLVWLLLLLRTDHLFVATACLNALLGAAAIALIATMLAAFLNL